jgi:uncharacterized protein involved in exopolysaccharide biosynthesis/pSer/pThr/pTyr-binding forkhead associated (FHA) protein
MSGSYDTRGQQTSHDIELTEADASVELVSDASLVVANGAGSGRSHKLTRRETTIGRSATAHVCIDEKPVSGSHAVIERDATGRHRLTDLGSTNGTFLNGRRLDANVPELLANGDSIQIAETVLVYVTSGNAPRTDTTRALSRLLPQLPESVAALPETQAFVQLLQGQSLESQERRPPTLEEQVDKILRILRMIRRNWVPLFAATALCTFVAIGTVFMKPPLAEATMKLRVSPPKGNALNQANSSQWDLDLFYGTTEQNFVSPGLITQTLKSMGHKNPTREFVNATATALTFESIGEALYLATYKHKDPVNAVNLLKHHLDGFLANEVSRSLHVAQAEVDFLTARLKETEAELAKNEVQLRDFKDKHLEGLPENSSSHLASRETLLTRRADLGAQAARAKLALDLARKHLKEEAPLLSAQASGSDRYEESLVEVNRKLGEARSSGLGEEHPQVVTLKKQAENLTRLAEEARRKAPTDFDRSANPGLVGLRHRVGELEVAHQGAQAELGAVGALLTRLDTIVSKMPEVEAQYAQLTRSYSATKDMHAKLFDKLRANQLQLELERASAKARYEVIAAPASKGVPLRKMLLARGAIGVAVGIAIGGLIAAFLELRRYLAARKLTKFAIVPVTR